MKSFIFYSLLFAFFIPSYSFAKDCFKQYQAMMQASSKFNEAYIKRIEAFSKYYQSSLDQTLAQEMQAYNKALEARNQEEQAFKELVKAWAIYDFCEANLN